MPKITTLIEKLGVESVDSETAIILINADHIKFTHFTRRLSIISSALQLALIISKII